NIPLFFTDATTFSSVPSNQSYRPLVSTLLAIDFRLGGIQPFWFHVSILALFVALTLLVAFVIYRLLQGAGISSTNRWIALAGAANAHNYLITQPYVIFQYVKTFFWPAGLSADYDLNPFATTDDPRFWAGFAFVILFAVCAVVAAVFKKTRVIGFGLLWFLIALLPTSLLPLAEVMNDHRTFLPYIRLVIAVAGAVW